ncbi:3-dehydroquinate synthase [Desulfatibacillum aliphaticivorans]|uniref:3-dehydroquinate synthase n=1 Tax=Desulfatibacillum aliphaticivorans TaxID=218208 RepID=B8FFQ1_DESAL|nr:3-dehydroquinate synthase II [Desulfatibacillum aliphaticivorans]ACL03456.1 3-dehydroquinate synthase [Desulfatibacillum aliphaticivorans]
MKTIWVKVDPWNKDLVTTALEGGADALMVPEGYAEKVKELGRITTIAPDGDMIPGQDLSTITITSMDDEDQIIQAQAMGPVIVDTPDWSIIPLENLIAKGARVVHPAKSLDEAKTAAGILEHGVWGVLIDTPDPAELKRILAFLKGEGTTAPVVPVEIMEVKAVGMGDRVCVDTCTDMKPGEGMLVGNSSAAMFLIHSESIENPYVAARPFRVNAGAVHAYTKVPGNKTRYLSELGAGDEVLITDYKGKCSIGVVGRLKIEKRPLLLITAKAGDKQITTICQNAETIRLVAADGKPLSVVALKPGDKVLASLEEGGRHFGHKIKETITEK